MEASCLVTCEEQVMSPSTKDAQSSKPPGRKKLKAIQDQREEEDSPAKETALALVKEEGEDEEREVRTGRKGRCLRKER